MLSNKARYFIYFVVVLTKQGRLVASHVRATSVSEALDKMISQNELAGNIVEFKHCLVSAS
jgi:hypothetical protein